jgi:hypothetical protein
MLLKKILTISVCLGILAGCKNVSSTPPIIQASLEHKSLINSREANIGFLTPVKYEENGEKNIFLLFKSN